MHYFCCSHNWSVVCGAYLIPPNGKKINERIHVFSFLKLLKSVYVIKNSSFLHHCQYLSLFDIINSDYVTYGAVSVFGKFTTEFGIIYIILLILLFCKKNIFNRAPYYAVGFLMILSGFSFAFPPIWLILSLKFNQGVHNYVHTRN